MTAARIIIKEAGADKNAAGFFYGQKVYSKMVKSQV
jgi:hypothetical protein